MLLMKMVLGTLALILGLLLEVPGSLASEVLREPETQFPRCITNPKTGYGFFFDWREKALTREIWVADPYYVTCHNYQEVLKSGETHWKRLDYKKFTFIPDSIRQELAQIAQKTNEFRTEFKAEEYLVKNPLENYTLETNRALTAKYGPLFSAQVFRAFIEQKPENKKFLDSVLNDLEKSDLKVNQPFSHLKGKVKLVVSFGLGWEEKYGKTVPYYIEDFLDEMKDLGLEVHFIKKNPFGTVKENIERMIPSLKKDLMSGQDLVFVSLCKGTPELLRAEAELMKLPEREQYGRILGHINLSGMLSGAIFSDFAKEVVFPKIIAPLMKIIPLSFVRDNAKMIDAIEFMKTSIIEENLNAAAPHLPEDLLYINITGAPMTNQVLEGNSPMKPIVQYGVRSSFINSANDGFLEMPSTLIPETISKNQLTLVLDATHVLSDGDLHGHKIGDKKKRKTLYYSVLKTIFEKTRPDYYQSESTLN